MNFWTSRTADHEEMDGISRNGDQKLMIAAGWRHHCTRQPLHDWLKQATTPPAQLHDHREA
jgi:hypothetical protein